MTERRSVNRNVVRNVENARNVRTQAQSRNQPLYTYFKWLDEQKKEYAVIEIYNDKLKIVTGIKGGERNEKEITYDEFLELDNLLQQLVECIKNLASVKLIKLND